MADEAPRVGQVVEHFFLWSEEQSAGQVEGRKPRPCVIASVEAAGGGQPRVTILPITSQPPRAGAATVAVPATLKPRLGLDPARSAWVVVDEANVFTWLGFDLVAQPTEAWFAAW